MTRRKKISTLLPEGWLFFIPNWKKSRFELIDGGTFFGKTSNKKSFAAEQPTRLMTFLSFFNNLQVQYHVCQFYLHIYEH